MDIVGSDLDLPNKYRTVKERSKKRKKRRSKEHTRILSGFERKSNRRKTTSIRRICTTSQKISQNSKTPMARRSKEDKMFLGFGNYLKPSKPLVENNKKLCLFESISEADSELEKSCVMETVKSEKERIQSKFETNQSTKIKSFDYQKYSIEQKNSENKKIEFVVNKKNNSFDIDSNVGNLVSERIRSKLIPKDFGSTNIKTLTGLKEQNEKTMRSSFNSDKKKFGGIWKKDKNNDDKISFFNNKI